MTTYHRFMQKIEFHESGCWIWNGYRNYQGYGKLRFMNEVHSAHRFSYLIFVGEIPEGLCICHSCDNPSCVYPGHLWAGTNLDNVQDKVSKGRTTKGAKLSDETRLKMSISRKGNPNCIGHMHTDESKIKIGLTFKGKPWSDARRNAQKGVVN